MSTGVFVVEEHGVVRRGLVELISASGELTVVGTAGSAAEALPLLAAAGADVVLLDLLQLDGSSIAGCRAIRSRHPDLPCVLLTSGDDEGLRAAVLAGAAGHLSKQVGGGALVDGLLAAAEGRMRLDPATTGPLLARLRTSWPGRPGSALDERGQQVLELVGLGGTDAQVAEKLDLPEAEVSRRVADLVARLGRQPSGGRGASQSARAAGPVGP